MTRLRWYARPPKKHKQDQENRGGAHEKTSTLGSTYGIHILSDSGSRGRFLTRRRRTRRRFWRRWRLQRRGRRCVPWRRCCSPQPFHELPFTLALIRITIETEAINQSCVSAEACFETQPGRIPAFQFFGPKASVDSQQCRIPASRFFRPEAVFDGRLETRHRRCETKPGTGRAVLESASTGRKRFVGSRQGGRWCCRGSPRVRRCATTAGNGR